MPARIVRLNEPSVDAGKYEYVSRAGDAVDVQQTHLIDTHLTQTRRLSYRFHEIGQVLGTHSATTFCAPAHEADKRFQRALENRLHWKGVLIEQQ
jgi:hypothetical protein